MRFRLDQALPKGYTLRFTFSCVPFKFLVWVDEPAQIDPPPKSGHLR